MVGRRRTGPGTIHLAAQAIVRGRRPIDLLHPEVPEQTSGDGHDYFSEEERDL